MHKQEKKSPKNYPEPKFKSMYTNQTNLGKTILQKQGYVVSSRPQRKGFSIHQINTTRIIKA